MNLPAMPDTTPDYLKQDPRLAALLMEAAAGIGGGMPPTIGLNGTRFVFKESGKDDETHNELTLQAVILRGKKDIEKTWYATKFTPGQETTSPDCFSMDGIKPDPSAKQKQCESCAGCPQNVFGTGTDAQGNPGKGKACTDKKILALYINKRGIFRFPIPPASLGSFATYCKQLGGRGIPLQGAMTVIGFDPSVSFPKVTFSFGGLIPEQVFPKVLAMVDSPEVAEIIDGALVALPAPADAGAARVEHKSIEDELAKAREEKERKEKEEKEEKERKAAEAKAKKAEKEAKEKAEKEAAAAAAANKGADLDLMAGAGAGAGDAAINADTQAVIDALGLDL